MSTRGRWFPYSRRLHVDSPAVQDIGGDSQSSRRPSRLRYEQCHLILGHWRSSTPAHEKSPDEPGFFGGRDARQSVTAPLLAGDASFANLPSTPRV